MFHRFSFRHMMMVRAMLTTRKRTVHPSIFQSSALCMKCRFAAQVQAKAAPSDTSVSTMHQKAVEEIVTRSSPESRPTIRAHSLSNL